MPSIGNSTILIIGGSYGIGCGVAQKALFEASVVHIASSNSPRVREITDALKTQFPNARISGHVCDLAGPDVEKSLERLLATIAPLDHIVFTAGDSLAIQPLSTIDLDAIHRAGHVRFSVPLLLAKLGPRFVNPVYKSWITLTSGAGSQKSFPNWSLIAGYHTGIYGITCNLALDLKPHRVNLVSPGVIATYLWGSDGVPDEVKDHHIE
ncbi:short-chain dehydrogenase [Penicillium samsonianum]|uniref:short-chain dehydrogenase n=1 Tax=Penicillium samsonianum TaxID=1882272 RepID=UPI002546F465|nr:short-chain dehydrogenase [Penicillium samsonianum]KAJ6125615.1 short-chain dehydrogenase [Penicillium samsonianum]